jgi:hypothetical protein
MVRRVLATLGVFAGLIVAAVVAAGAYTALKTPLQASPNSNLAPENCSPGPCTDLHGYTIWVSNVRLDNDVVRMTVKFQNSSPSTHASPEDLQLIDQSRRSSVLITDTSGCNTWTRHEFIQKGEIFGPVDICFRLTNTTPPFLLRWSPDEGAFCCERDLKLYLS